MARIARIEETGGPEVIHWVESDLPAPAAGEARVRQTAIGVNFIDTYHRSGVYPLPMPAGLGVEAVGVVTAVGEGIGVAVGDRVGYIDARPGAYATDRNVEVRLLFKLPDAISDERAAAALLKGCTVEALVERCAQVQAGWTVLVHAAAGGVGLLLVQWLKALGATVIGTVSTEEKAEIARGAGADHIIFYTREDTASRVREITRGAGVRVVFDGVGKATFESSIDSLAKRGMLVSFGNAGGTVGLVDFGILARKGSLFATRPTVFDYYADPEERAKGAARVFEMLEKGTVKVTLNRQYRIDELGEAHRDLEGRKTHGSSIIIP